MFGPTFWLITKRRAKSREKRESLTFWYGLLAF
ncbi:hypothetical protein LOK49_LG07G00544 [Camellia lanceoleosa]|uniref:Uncharacterized protein n=1 Tax=Camellia lanceoleosa TaxID=1840588 RepID=A0ACC0H629_9ERIC|nr:hypothetical protein LOK49_LG07G00544 [Camellia lanceoleosa]